LEVQEIGEDPTTPGQLRFVLVDAVRTRTSISYRFTLHGGAREHLALVKTPQREVRTFKAEPRNKDLRVIVTLPPPAAEEKAQGLEIKLASGATYHFRLSDSSIWRVLKDVRKKF
jgi:hypothetical protein